MLWAELGTMLRTVLKSLLVLLVLKTVVISIANLADYIPPDFRSDFLLGRESYFFGWYQWAFYAHVIAGPAALASGLVLISSRFRREWPKAHRRLGRAHCLVVLFIVSPSGLGMARHAAGGSPAAWSLACLALATACCTAAGWRAAVRRRYAAHELWMKRSYVLLLSAVVLRVLGGASEVFGIEAAYQVNVWLSWIMPLMVFEIWPTSRHRSIRRQQTSASPLTTSG